MNIVIDLRRLTIILAGLGCGMGSALFLLH